MAPLAAAAAVEEEEDGGEKEKKRPKVGGGDSTPSAATIESGTDPAQCEGLTAAAGDGKSNGNNSNKSPKVAKKLDEGTAPFFRRC
jgi:hypothetical protein